MADVVRVRAATNNEVAFIAWDVDGMIPGCLGFELVRLYPDTGEERCLASWVPFKGQRNKDWIPQDTGVWPVQKTFWRDLTVRRRRDSLTMRPDGEMIAYRVRPVGAMKPGLEPVPVRPGSRWKAHLHRHAAATWLSGEGGSQPDDLPRFDVRQGTRRLHQWRIVDAMDVARAD